MLRGLYTAASALLADETWQSVIGNNLDNVETPGYKADQTVMGEFDAALMSRVGPSTSPIGASSAGTGVVETVANLSEGGLEETGQSLDVAPTGGAWLSVRTAQGVQYTQDGALSLSPTGEIVNAAGDAVLGTGGRPITLPAGEAVSIAQDGNVSAGGRVVGRLLLTAFTNPARLEAQGSGLFTAPAAAGARLYAPGTGVEAGFLEGSNVNESELTTELISAQNSFQANQASLTTQSQTFGDLIQDLGK